MTDAWRASIDSALAAGRVRWTQHLVERMIKRGLTRAEVLEVLQAGEVIESDDGRKPHPIVVVLGATGGGLLHVVVGVERQPECIHVVTAYVPGTEKFEVGGRKRRR